MKKEFIEAEVEFIEVDTMIDMALVSNGSITPEEGDIGSGFGLGWGK